MSTQLINVEIRPGFVVRMRPEEAERLGFKAVAPAAHKQVAAPTVKPAVKKTGARKAIAAKKPADKPATDQEDDGGAGDDR